MNPDRLPRARPPDGDRDLPVAVALAARSLTVHPVDGGHGLGDLDLELWWTEQLAVLDLDGGPAGQALLACVTGERRPSSGSILVAAGADVRRGPGGHGARLVVVVDAGGRRRRAVLRWTTDPADAARADRVVVIQGGRAVAQLDEPCVTVLSRYVNVRP
jgi:hypothetical protein